MTRVLAVAAQGPESPAFRIRTGIPAPAMRDLGVDLEPLPLFDGDEERRFRGGGLLGKLASTRSGRRRLRHRLRERSEVATVLVQRQVDLLPGLSTERLAIDGRRAILDVDDAIWLDTTREAGGHALSWLKQTRRKVTWLAQRADHVVAGNEHLAEWLSPHTTHLNVVPSLVEPSTQPLRKHADGPTILLGWIGSSSTAPYLAAVREPLVRAAQMLAPREVELLVVGGPELAIPGVRVRVSRWSIEAERAMLGSIDIGLMPQPDAPWTRGKCGYKALQYMAAGIPVIADDVGTSASVIGHERAGLIARQPRDWVEYVVALAGDVTLRERLGSAGRRRIEADFSVQRWAPVLAEILRG